MGPEGDNMKKSIIVRGPVLSQSGYGEHTRFVLRALRSQEEKVDIFVLPTGWGETGWLSDVGEERSWIDERVQKTNERLNLKVPFDISVQVTIPNEWEKLAMVNIGVTAGIETNKVSPVWVEKSNYMNKVITISEHSKNGFTTAVYNGHNKETNQPMTLKMETPVEVVGYPVKNYENLPDLNIELEYDFNYLTIAQWGPRKNLHNIIHWFIEENFDQEVGLIVKTSLKNNSIVDREYTELLVKEGLNKYPERKCKIYLLHGDLSEIEVHSLYKHDKIKCLVSLTHGEGFGLPMFEAAYSGLPVIAPGWSGQCDFLYAPPPKKKGKRRKAKGSRKPYFAEVDFVMNPVPKSAIWEGVVEKGTSWCFPVEGSYKMKLRQIRNEYPKWLERAKHLQRWVCKEFDKDKMYKKMCEAIIPEEIAPEEVDALFAELLEGA